MVWRINRKDYEKRISVMLVRNETLIIGTSNGKVEYYDIPTKNLTRVFEPIGYWIDIFENEIFTQTDSTKCYESYDLYSHEFLKRYCATGISHRLQDDNFSTTIFSKRKLLDGIFLLYIQATSRCV
jgi:hypothetical protein